MKKLLSAGLISFTLILPLFAQIKDLTIDAEKVSFDRAKNRVEATGSVEVNYQDIRLRGNHLIYNTSAETFHADRGFVFLYAGSTFEGEALDYDLRERAGQAANVSFIYQGVRLNGGRLKFNEEEFEIKGAGFTTCDPDNPHYRVTAADLLLYPREGWLVAYWGYFWLWQIPVVPMPTYIYDFNAGERAERNIPPFPMIGSNFEDGNYLIETLAWNLRRELSGSYSLGYLTNKGVMLGAQANYIVNDRNRGNLRLNWNPKDNTVGGLTHLFSFGAVTMPKDDLPFEAILQRRTRQYELETTLSSRERINYQRVSFTPNVVLQSRSLSVGQNLVKTDIELTGGVVAEEGNIRLARGGGKVKFYSNLGQFSPSLLGDAIYYSNGTRWIKPAAGLGYRARLSDSAELLLDYTHYLYIEGQTPFNYELYRYRAADTLRGDLLFKIGETEAKIAAAYFLDDWSPQDIDYTLFFKLHCYNLEVTYRSLRSEFMLGFSLATR